MTATTATTQALIGWINETRQHAPMLDNEADALLARLNAARAREEALERALVCQGSIGLYGHSQAAKAHLLASLCGSGDERLNVTPGQRTFDYFSHINPGMRRPIWPCVSPERPARSQTTRFPCA